jgi:hypothetical protein
MPARGTHRIAKRGQLMSEAVLRAVLTQKEANVDRELSCTLPCVAVLAVKFFFNVSGNILQNGGRLVELPKEKSV